MSNSLTCSLRVVNMSDSPDREELLPQPPASSGTRRREVEDRPWRRLEEEQEEREECVRTAPTFSKQEEQLTQGSGLFWGGQPGFDTGIYYK